MGRLIDIENIDYVRLEDSLHCLEHHKDDEVECVICAPLVEAISKTDYETRLKADMIAMLEDLNLEIDEMFARRIDYTVDRIQDLIQQKIDKLKENKNESY